MGCCWFKKSNRSSKNPEIKLTLVRKFTENYGTYESNKIQISQELIEDNEGNYFLQKGFLSKTGGEDGNIQKILNSEIAAYKDIQKHAHTKNCLPTMSIRKDNLKMIIILSSYKNRFTNILENNNQEILEEISINLENTLKKMLESLIELNKIGINHLNINPSNMFFSDKGDMKLLNFIIPASFKVYNENTDNVFENIFYIGNAKFNWTAPELNSRPNKYDKEKADIYAIGNFIQYFSDKNDTFSRLSRAMTVENPNSRPSLEDCLGFITNKYPKIELLGSYKKLSQKNLKSIYYDCSVSYIDYFLNIYEVKEITAKSEDGKTIIKEYRSNMMVLDSLSNDENSYIKVYETSQIENKTIIISEYYGTSLEDYFQNISLIVNDDPWDILVPLLYSFNYLYEKKIFHGHVCLKNFLITPKNTVKISGFLIEGRHVVNDNAKLEYLASNGMILAPELLKKEQIISEELDIFKTDVYALGLSFYRLVCHEMLDQNIINHSKIRKNLENLEKMNSNMRTILLNMIQGEHNRYSIFDCIKFNQETV